MFGTFRDSAELSWGLSLTALPIDKLYSQSGKVFRLPWELNLLLPCFVFAQTVHPACRYCTVLYCRGQLGSIWEKKRHPPPLFLSRCTYSMALPLSWILSGTALRQVEHYKRQSWVKDDRCPGLSHSDSTKSKLYTALIVYTYSINVTNVAVPRDFFGFFLSMYLKHPWPFPKKFLFAEIFESANC